MHSQRLELLESGKRPEPLFIRIERATAKRLKVLAKQGGRYPGNLLCYTIDKLHPDIKTYPESTPPKRGDWERIRVRFFDRAQQVSITQRAAAAGRPIKSFLADAAHYFFNPEGSSTFFNNEREEADQWR